MTTIPIPSPADPGDTLRWDRLERVRDLLRRYVREPDDVTDDGTTLALVFTPDLSAAQLALVNRIIRITGLLTITPAEWASLEGVIDTLRTARTRTDAEWAALTAAQRDSQLIAWCRGITDVLRALLRD